MILITGHPRSGTAYMSALFSANGIDVGHEKMGRDGISTWMACVAEPIEGYPVECPDVSNVAFDKVIYVLRDPIQAISSIAFTEGATDDFRAQYVTCYGSFLERAVLSYVGWIRLAKARFPEMQVVALEKSELLPNINISFEDIRINSREHPFINEHDLYRMVSSDVWVQYEWIKRQWELLITLEDGIYVDK